MIATSRRLRPSRRWFVRNGVTPRRFARGRSGPFPNRSKPARSPKPSSSWRTSSAASSVLDLASGPVSRRLTLARSVGQTGHVTATDLSAGMLAAAEARAREQGLRNISFQTPTRTRCRLTTHHSIGSPVASARCISRMLPGAMREIWRVLRPSGRVALVTWGPFDRNPFMTSALIPFFKRVDVSPRHRERRRRSSTPNRKSWRPSSEKPGSRTCRLNRARYHFPGQVPRKSSGSTFTRSRLRSGRWIDGLPEDQRAEAIGEVLAGFRQYEQNGRIAMTAAVVVASGNSCLIRSDSSGWSER